MKRKLVNTLWAMGLLTVASLCLPACDRELEVQQAYDFTLETMPVPKDIRRGETAEIRCSLKRAGRFAGARYTLRYFQSEGKGMLRLEKGAALKPNDRYPLVREEFCLYYTSQPATLPRHRRIGCLTSSVANLLYEPQVWRAWTDEAGGTTLSSPVLSSSP